MRHWFDQQLDVLFGDRITGKLRGHEYITRNKLDFKDRYIFCELSKTI